VRASNLGRQSHQVIALAAIGQLGMAAAGQIRLAVVTLGDLGSVGACEGTEWGSAGTAAGRWTRT
jgi:hypothetical protein